jgi:dolichol-phosphate mannosyltransferase
VDDFFKNAKKQMSLMNFSLIIPFSNEEEIIGRISTEVPAVLESIEYINKFEIICVDDGSTDKTLEYLNSIDDSRFKIISFDKNYGQSTAVYAGINNSRYDILGIIDGDLQTDPGEFEKLILKLKEGFDCVNGKRVRRKDGVGKRFSTWIARKIRQLVLKDGFYDITCPLKVLKKEAISSITFFDTFHRFIPFLVQMQGYRVVEIEVRHYPRTHGKSHYTALNRLWVGIKSMFAIRWMARNYIKYNLRKGYLHNEH